MKLNHGNLWFGTEESYEQFVAAKDSVAHLVAQGEAAVKLKLMELRAGKAGSDDIFAMPSLVNISGGIATIDISGSLVNGFAGFGRFFGVLGYGDIQEALQEALASKDAKTILLNIDSGGGQVAGVQDTGNLIRQVAAVKPVIAYTDGVMASAAYWLGVSADKVYGSNLAQVGSVGTLIVHMEMSKAIEAGGRKVTMIRYGDYKALANSYEPLSDKGKEQLQSLANASGKIFVEYTADRRGTTPAKFQATMGEGRVFMGEDANAVGLLDGVMSFSDVMKTVKSLDNNLTGAHNSPNSKRTSSMKAKLSTKTLLAIAAGVALDGLGLSAPEANAEGIALEATALTALTAEATELVAAVAAARTAAVDTAVTAAVATATTELTSKLSAAELAAKTLGDKVTILEAAATDLTGKLNASATLSASQATIVKDSISVMSVALGGTADVGAALSGADLMAEHERLKASFVKKFPAGGVAAVNVDFKPKDTVKANGPNAHFRSLLQKSAA